jgi:hypothetical protein
MRMCMLDVSVIHYPALTYRTAKAMRKVPRPHSAMPPRKPPVRIMAARVFNFVPFLVEKLRVLGVSDICDV